MLLRVRVTLPDRPGTLGQVARTLGVSGADIVQVVVLERLGGRAVDDFTVVWPGAARVERLLAGLAAIPGVRVDGVWRAIGAPTTTGQDAELLAQVAANPADGLATLVDAVPGLLAADWAVAAVVPVDWASRHRRRRGDRGARELACPGTPAVAGGDPAARPVDDHARRHPPRDRAVRPGGPGAGGGPRAQRDPLRRRRSTAPRWTGSPSSSGPAR